MGVSLTLSHVGKAYGRQIVLRNVSHKFQGMSLITGPNGAGKSTLLRVIAGLCRPDMGEVEAAGKIGYLGHATFIYPELTALENLAFWARANGLKRITPAQALERVGLEKFSGERARVFSRGMAQRLNLARVLLGEPEILLLDEPETGLDASARELLRSEIDWARQNDACVLLVSHESGMEHAPDCVLELRGGRLAPA